MRRKWRGRFCHRSSERRLKPSGCQLPRLKLAEVMKEVCMRSILGTSLKRVLKAPLRLSVLLILLCPAPISWFLSSSHFPVSPLFSPPYLSSSLLATVSPLLSAPLPLLQVTPLYPILSYSMYFCPLLPSVL